MADKTQLRVADQGHFSNDDPFAELTRIMGFDPRPSAPQQPEAEPAAGEQEMSADDFDSHDFGIDLEKELMGEFSFDDAGQDTAQAYEPTHEPHAASYHVEAPVAYQPEASVQEPQVSAYAPEEDHLLAVEPAEEVYFEPAELAVEEYQPAAPVQYGQAAAAYEYAPQAAAAYEYAPQAAADDHVVAMDAFDDAFAASLDADLATNGEWSDAAPAQESSEPQAAASVYEAEYEPAVGYEQADVAFAEPVQEFSAPQTAVSVYEAAFEAEYEPAVGYEQADVAFAEPVQEFSAPQAAASGYETAFEAEYEQAVGYEQADVAFAEPADQFDDAFAASLENDLALNGDWLPGEDVAPVAAQESEALSTYQPAAAYQEPFVEQPADDAGGFAGEEDFAGHFDAALAEVDMDFTAIPLKSSGKPSFEPQADLVEPAVAAEPEPVGLSLEDELNALLGNMSKPQPIVSESIAVEPVYTLDEQESEAPADIDMGLADEDFLSEAPSTYFHEPVAQAPVEHGYARGNYRIEQPSYGASAEETYAVANVAYEPEPELVTTAEAEPDLDLDFDDDAFNVAFANSFEDIEPAAYADEQPAAEELQAQPVEELEDPYAELAALTASFTPAVSASSWGSQPAVPFAEPLQHADGRYDRMEDGQEEYSSSFGYDDVPDIETVDVPEQAVALADDLDLPELAFQEDVPAASNYDDLDAEFASLLNDMNSPEPVAPSPAPATANEADDFAADFEREFQVENEAYAANYAYPAAAVAAAGALGVAAARSGYAPAASAGEAGHVTGGFSGVAARGQYQQPAADEFDFDSDLDDDTASPAYSAQERRQPQRRGALIAAVIGGVVVVGGLGAYALSGGGAGSGAPAIIKADEGPIKMRPENPGGTAVPNQDSKVYETVARTGTSAEPTQQRLVTTAETPIDMAAQEAPVDEEDTFVGVDETPAAPAGKSEDRILQAMQDDTASQNTEVAAVAPRKVRTMIVKPDGTLVPREEPAAVVDPATTASEGATGPAVSEAAASVQEATGAEPVPTEAVVAPKAASKPQSSTTPSSMAVAPTRPSDQPVNVVGEVKPDQVAALNAASAGAAGEWSMQIASQPSEAAAQSSYQDLLRRYGGVLNGRPANIVKAEIAGKGTFWRVRVPAPTRNEAITLCESYKTAGGNCFVSK